MPCLADYRNPKAPSLSFIGWLSITIPSAVLVRLKKIIIVSHTLMLAAKPLAAPSSPPHSSLAPFASSNLQDELFCLMSRKRSLGVGVCHPTACFVLHEQPSTTTNPVIKLHPYHPFHCHTKRFTPATTKPTHIRPSFNCSKLHHSRPAPAAVVATPRHTKKQNKMRLDRKPTRSRRPPLAVSLLLLCCRKHGGLGHRPSLVARRDINRQQKGVH